MKTAKGLRGLPAFVDKEQGPGDILHLWLYVAWVVEQAAEREEQLGLHRANELSHVRVGGPESAKPSQGVPSASIGIAGPTCR